MSKRDKITKFKSDHGIWTYYTRGIEIDNDPWTAFLSIDSDKREPMSAIAEDGELLEHQNRMVFCRTEIIAIKTLCQKNNIPCPL